MVFGSRSMHERILIVWISNVYLKEIIFGIMNKKIVLISIAIFLIIVIASIPGIKHAVKSDSLDNIHLPQGFKIEVFADILDGSSGPRMMLLKNSSAWGTGR